MIFVIRYCFCVCNGEDCSQNKGTVNCSRDYWKLSVDSMKALDLVTMKQLDSKVNIIPVIAKADTITKTELQKFKSKVSFKLISGAIVVVPLTTVIVTALLSLSGGELVVNGDRPRVHC